MRGFREPLDLDWSPASNSLAILTLLENGRKAIWTVRPDGSQQRKVIEGDGLASPRWSPAGDAIYFLRSSQGGTQDLLKVAVNPKTWHANDPASMLVSGLQAGDYFTVSADGMRLAYSRSQVYSNLWLCQFQGPANGKEPGKRPQTAPLTKGTSRFDMPSISPDGKWIAYSTQGHIFKMPIEGGTPTQVTVWHGADVNPAWSPDGTRIAFGSDEDGVLRVWIINADGGQWREYGKTQLSRPDNDEFGMITWSPGRHILYERPGNQEFNFLDPETEEEKPLLEKAAGWLFCPKYSPDYRKVAVFRNRHAQHAVWVISLVDNSETFLHDGMCYPAGWSPDGSSVYAYCGSDMLSIPAGGGIPHTVFTAPGDIASASVSADGNKFVYSVVETKSDVWIMDNFDPAYRK